MRAIVNGGKEVKMMEYIFIALSDLTEQEDVRTVLEHELSGYRVSFVKPSIEPEALLQDYSFRLIIVDYAFGGGALAEFAVLWSLPCILIADIQQKQSLRQMLYNEMCSFLIRDNDKQYLDVLALIAEKQIQHSKALSMQNSYIRFSEDRYFKLVQNLPDVVFHLDVKGHIMFINQAVNKLGFSPQDLCGTHFSVFLRECSAVPVKPVSDLGGSGEGTDTTSSVCNIDGEQFMFGETGTFFGEIRTAPCIPNPKNEEAGETVGIIRDITGLYTKQQELEHINREKEKLLNELHHRARNNLQLIISMIQLHRDNVSSSESTQLLEHIKAEVRSIASAHEQLYGSECFSGILMDEYLRSIALDLQNSATETLRMRFTGKTPSLPIQQAILIGIIVCELFFLIGNCNSASSGRKPEISISGSTGEDDILSLIIAFMISAETMPEQFTPSESDQETTDGILLTLGGKQNRDRVPPKTQGKKLNTALLKILVEQLSGTLTFEEQQGALRGTIVLSGE